MRSTRTRRAFLGTVGTALAGGVAGCSGSPTGAEGSPTDADTRTGTRSTTHATTDAGEPTPPRNASGSTGSDADDIYARLYRETVDAVALVRVPGGSQGTGFLIRDEYLVTNYHVVTDNDRVSLRFGDDTSQTGRVVGRDPRSDLAVVRTEPLEGVEPLALVDEEPAIGTRVAVVGSPYGLEGSLTTGVVSGVDRQVPSPQGDYQIPNAIQTDAAVNPGNSGGPLVNLSGEVLGVVNSGGGDNIAFAISAPLVRRVVAALIERGEYEHPTLGIRGLTVTELVARANGLPDADGVLVVEVPEDAPAAGTLRPCTDVETVEGFRVPVGGDVILSIDGTRITSERELHAHLALEVSADTTVPVTIRRDGETRTVQVEVGAMPALTP